MYRIAFTNKYLKSLKLARKRGLDESKIDTVIQLLVQGEKLPEKQKDHALTGEYKGYRECHIQPDWLLIYRIDKAVEILLLVDTGTHADLF